MPFQRPRPRQSFTASPAKGGIAPAGKPKRRVRPLWVDSGLASGMRPRQLDFQLRTSHQIRACPAPFCTESESDSSSDFCVLHGMHAGTLGGLARHFRRNRSRAKT